MRRLFPWATDTLEEQSEPQQDTQQEELQQPQQGMQCFDMILDGGAAQQELAFNIVLEQPSTVSPEAPACDFDIILGEHDGLLVADGDELAGDAAHEVIDAAVDDDTVIDVSGGVCPWFFMMKFLGNIDSPCESFVKINRVFNAYSSTVMPKTVLRTFL